VVANGASECSSKFLESEELMRGAPWACRRFRLVAALRSRWLWRHLYRKVNANCEMHTKKKQSGYESKSFAIPRGTMMEHNLRRPLSSKVPAWFERKFDFTFPGGAVPQRLCPPVGHARTPGRDTAQSDDRCVGRQTAGEVVSPRACGPLARSRTSMDGACG